MTTTMSLWVVKTRRFARKRKVAMRPVEAGTEFGTVDVYGLTDLNRRPT